MFRRLPRYPSYDQPIDWLEAVPAHWVRRRFGTVLREKDARSIAGEEQLLRVSQYTGVTERRTESGEGIDSRSESLIGYKKVSKGQLAVNIMLAWNGSLGVSRYDGIVSPAYCVYSFKGDADPWYFHHLLRSAQFKARIKANSRGIVDSRLRLYSEDLYRLEAIVPPLEEQAAIVKYLAHANTRIDKAIAAKRHLTTLLDEQKIVIARGEIDRVVGPRMPLKRALHSMTAGVWGAAPEESDDEAHWCVRVADFDYSSGRVKAGPKTMRSIADSDFARKRLQYGDLLLEGSGGGDKISVGRVVVFDHDDPAVCSNFLQRLRPAPGVDSEYLAIVLRDMHSTGTVRLHIKQTTGIQNLDLGTFLAAEVPVPVEAIQRDVVRRTKDAFLENDLVLERVKREIALLQEFRTRLIADVVTGQVDVRAIASTLPEAPESIDHLIPAVDDDLEEALSEGEG